MRSATSPTRVVPQELRAVIVVLLCSLAINMSPFATNNYNIHLLRITPRTIVFITQGIAFLSYPFLGWLADVLTTRHKAILSSLIMRIVSSFLLIAFGIPMVLYDQSPTVAHDLTPFLAAAMLASIVATGLFKANSIQFGMDQMLEASTKKLVTFIHWYYWTEEVGRLLLDNVEVGILAYFSSCKMSWSDVSNTFKFSAWIFTFILIFTEVIALLVFVSSKGHFYVQRAGLNPFKTVYRVLKYAKNHTFPENRSAFTYWEEDIPSRVDLGKSKYGGPFTTEEVEDTKTFLRILPLLLTLFGFHLAGDGYSATEQFLRTSCPSLPVLLLVVANPRNISTLVVILGVPLYRMYLRCFQQQSHRILQRMHLGLLLSLPQAITYICISITSNTAQRQNHSILYTENALTNCYWVRSSFLANDTDNMCVSQTDPVDNTYLWFIIPQLLNGVSSLLVSMTALELICAQAPRTTQGILIGLWYATFSIRYLFVAVLDTYISERRSWLIYEGVKGFLILVSLALYSCVSRHYRYRQRDEIVNVQGMIEEIYERRMDQEKAFQEECRALHDHNIHSYSSIP